MNTLLIKDIEEYLSESNLWQVDSKYDNRESHRVKGISPTAVLREQARDEMILEYDALHRLRANMLIKRWIKKLKANGYNFFVWDHGGKSPHIHIYNIKGLEKLDLELRSIYLHLFRHKYTYGLSDDCFCKSQQAVAMENRLHFKYNTLKQLIGYHTDGSISNELEPDLVIEAHHILTKRLEKRATEPQNEEGNEWFINWITNDTELEYLSSMNLHLFKNLAILIVNHNNPREEDILSQLSDKFGRKVYGQMKGWLNWARQDRRHFSIMEVQRFFERYDIDFTRIRYKWDLKKF